jgi:membrane-anchored mycosin MYCP
MRLVSVAASMLAATVALSPTSALAATVSPSGTPAPKATAKPTPTITITATARPAPKPTATKKTSCSQPSGENPRQLPPALSRLAAARVWPISSGAGVTVAVIGSGVDANNSQLDGGHTKPGATIGSTDFGPPDEDCDGAGTAAAGLIAAERQPQNTAFAGIAPNATLLAYRVRESLNNSQKTGGPNDIAGAIVDATNKGATVISVTSPTPTDSSKLRAAVKGAIRRGVVVVSSGKRDGAQSGPTYPTSYPEVLAVAGIGADGKPLSDSDQGNYIDVAAPTYGLISTAAGAGRGKLGFVGPFDDSSLAAALVAGTVALVRSYRPGLNAVEVIRRIKATADRPASGATDPLIGWGVVNPYEATVTTLAGESVGPVRRTADPVVAKALVGDPDRATRQRSLLIALGGFALVGVTMAVAGTIRAGRRRRWAPGTPELPGVRNAQQRMSR